MDRRTKVWVKPKEKQTARNTLEVTKRKFDRYNNGCLFVVDTNGRPCGKPVDNLCHTIPHRPVLMPMSDRESGKVREVIWGFENFADLFIRSTEEDPVDLSDTERFQPRLIGIGEASCGRFACKNPPNSDHESAFGPIDVANPDFNDPLVAFLAQYRAYLYAVYQLKRADRLMKDWNRKIMREGAPAQRNIWFRNKELLRERLPLMQQTLSRLGAIWYAEGRSVNTTNAVIASQQFCFRSKLTFAACVFYGRGSVASIFPVEGDLHQMGITHFLEDTQNDAEFTKELVEKATTSMEKPDYGVTVINCLDSLSSGVIESSGVIDMSPSSYDGLSDADRNSINQMVEKFAQADMMAKTINSMLANREYTRKH